MDARRFAPGFATGGAGPGFERSKLRSILCPATTLLADPEPQKHSKTLSRFSDF